VSSFPFAHAVQMKIFRIREVFMASRIINGSSHHTQLRMTQLVMPYFLNMTFIATCPSVGLCICSTSPMAMKGVYPPQVLITYGENQWDTSGVHNISIA
jgi:hypothetical protein